MGGCSSFLVAAMIPGTLVDRFLEHSCSDKGVRIGHAAGIMDADPTVTQEGGSWICTKASLVRTARTLMRGEVLIAR